MKRNLSSSMLMDIRRALLCLQNQLKLAFLCHFLVTKHYTPPLSWRTYRSFRQKQPGSAYRSAHPGELLAD